MPSIFHSHSPPPPSSSTTTPQVHTTSTTAFPLPKIVKILQTPNTNNPAQNYQLNSYLLYETEFHGDTYVSAHLQRLQHGLVDSPLMSGDRKFVTFVAVEFCFHPAVEREHRFRDCVVEITVGTEGGLKVGEAREWLQLRFVKYAPHLAFGRISAESLKWNFQLGSKVGVTEGPVDLSVNPTGSYERDRTVGAMMRIQGSTRSISPSLPQRSHHRPLRRQDLRDRRLVWSLEENDQQEAGLPREFTFVFLVEQPPPHIVDSTKFIANENVVIGDISSIFKDLTIGIKIKPNITGFGLDIGEDEVQYTTIKGEVGQRFRTAEEHQKPSNAAGAVATMKYGAEKAVRKGSSYVKKSLSSSPPPTARDGLPTLTSTATATTNNKPTNPTTTAISPAKSTITTFPSPEASTEAGFVIGAGGVDAFDGSATDTLSHYFKSTRSASVFAPANSHVNLNANSTPVAAPAPKGRGGVELQRRETGREEGERRKLFNFAVMEGSFEDLIELPGNAVTSVEPTIGV